MWLVFAILSAVFAALTSILAKVGIDGVNSTLATAIRIGNPASWEKAEAARDESGGIIDCVTDEEIIEAYRNLTLLDKYLLKQVITMFIMGVLVFTSIIFAPRIFIFATLGACFSISTVPICISHSKPKYAAAVATATPWLPAPVSAISFFFPKNVARRASPIQVVF